MNRFGRTSRINIGLLPVLAALWAVASASYGQTVDLESDSRFYYGWRGAIQALERSNDIVAVTFKEDAALEDVEALTSLMPQVRPLRAAALRNIAALRSKVANGRLREKATFMLQTIAGTQGDDLKATVRQMRQSEGVASIRFAYKVNGSERNSLTTDMFYVTVENNPRIEAAIEARFRSDGLEVFQKRRYAPLGSIGYRVQVPQEVQADTGADAIYLANQYHQSPLTLNAAPTFEPLYQLATTDEPEYVAAHNQAPSTFQVYGQSGTATEKHQGGWNLDQMNASQAWETVYGEDGPTTSSRDHTWSRVVIANMDDGVALNYTADEAYPSLPDRTELPSGWSPDNFMKPFDEDFDTAVPGAGFEAGPEGHVNLNPNQWLNYNELGGTPNFDDDDNGLIDDYFGWDFVGNDPTKYLEGTPPMPGDPVPYSDYNVNFVLTGFRGHGTSQAGVTQGYMYEADKNDTSRPRLVTGTCLDCLIMPVRYHVNNYTDDLSSVQQDIGSNVWYVAHAEQALLYAAGINQDDPSVWSETKADVVGWMIALDTYDPGLEMAVKLARMRDVVVLANTGNHGLNVDSRPLFPTVFPEVIAVGGVTPAHSVPESEGKVGTPQNPMPIRSTFPNGSSSWGHALDIVAPTYRSRYTVEGTPNIEYNYRIMGTSFFGPTATTNNSSVNGAAGNSSALPQAAGVAGLVLKAAKKMGDGITGANAIEIEKKRQKWNLAAAEVQAIVQWTAQDIVHMDEAAGGTHSFVNGRYVPTSNGTHVPKDIQVSNRMLVEDVTGYLIPNPGAYNIDQYPPGRDIYTGYGQLDMAAAVNLARKQRDRHPRGVRNGVSPAEKFLYSFDDEGNFVLDGVVVNNATTGQLNATLGRRMHATVPAPDPNADPIVTANLVYNQPDPGDGTSEDPGDAGYGANVVLYLKGEFTSLVDDLGQYDDDLSDHEDYDEDCFPFHSTESTSANKILQGFISEAGNMFVRGRSFFGGNPDAWDGADHWTNQTVFVVDNNSDLQDMIENDYEVGGVPVPVPDHSTIIVKPGTYGPITLNRDLVIRSMDPYGYDTYKRDGSGNNWANVEATEINGGGTAPAVTLGPNATKDAAIIGFTITGGNAAYGGGILGAADRESELSRARILRCRIVGNNADMAGGAIWGHGGLIEGNMIGVDGDPNTAKYGAALAECYGPIRLNLVQFNEAAASGGGFYRCRDVRRNLIYKNQATYGGAGAYMGSFSLNASDAKIFGMTQGNIIAENTAATTDGDGGAIFEFLGRMENNTIYGNVCSSTNAGKIGGVMSSSTLASDSSPSSRIFQNNIVWENLGGPSDAANEVSPPILQIAVFCAIDQDFAQSNGNIPNDYVAPSNFKPLSSVSGNPLGFESQTFTQANWGTYLRLGADSPCIDAGATLEIDYDPNDLRDHDLRRRDFDDQVAYVDIANVGNSYISYQLGSPVVQARFPVDIGADEYPTDPQGLAYWWENF